jgi:hypothetical protein
MYVRWALSPPTKLELECFSSDFSHEFTRRTEQAPAFIDIGYGRHLVERHACKGLSLPEEGLVVQVEAAQQAVDRGIRIYTIGFGTEEPGGRPPTCGAQQIGREPGDSGQSFIDSGLGGGGGGGGGGGRRAIDEETLMAVAETTGGEYYPAESAEQLVEVFEQLPTDVIMGHEVVEISVAFTAIAVLLVSFAILLGQAWRPLP